MLVTILLVCSLLFPVSISASEAEFPLELSLAEAIEQGLAKHAAVRATAARVSGAESLIRQAGLRPNPSVFFQSENWRFTGEPGFQAAQDLDVFAYLSQPIEVAGKRGHRLELARQDLKIAELERRALEWKIRQDIKQAFWRALLSQKQLDIMKENSRNFQQIIEYHRARVEQGAMPEADLIKVRLEGERLGVAEDTVALESERARVELMRTMGLTEVTSRFRLIEPQPAGFKENVTDLQSLTDRAHSQRFEVLLGRSLVERARAQLTLQQSQAHPDWHAVFGYKRTSGYDTLLAGVSVSLPISDRNQGNIAQSLSEVTRSQATLEGAIAQVNAELTSALGALRRRHAMLSQMQKGMLERAEESSRVALAAYQEGGTDLLYLLEAQRARNDVLLLYTRTQVEYQISLAELETAVGEGNLSIGEELLRVEH